MDSYRRTALAMAGYVVGLLALFGAALVFLGGLPANSGGVEVRTEVNSVQPAEVPPAPAP